MNETDPMERTDPRAPERNANTDLPIERLDRERLRAWRSDCRHHIEELDEESE
jgi:hypothetical protein